LTLDSLSSKIMTRLPSAQFPQGYVSVHHMKYIYLRAWQNAGRGLNVPGVYLLTGLKPAYIGRVCIYAGMAKSIYRRWQRHNRTIDLFYYSDLKLHYLEMPEEFLRENEAKLIEMYRPELNTNSGQYTVGVDPSIEELCEYNKSTRNERRLSYSSS
jgi:hypothetical protein